MSERMLRFSIGYTHRGLETNEYDVHIKIGINVEYTLWLSPTLLQMEFQVV